MSALLRPVIARYPSRVVWALALGTIVPLLTIAASWRNPQPDIWAHFWQYVLPAVLLNSAVLSVGVGLGVLLLGLSLAWLTAVCDFPGRRFFTWALFLPLALPAYVVATVMIGLFDFSGPLQSQLRQWWGPQLRLPEVRSRTGAIVVFSLTLYPYVYVLARQAFTTQGVRALEAAQLLGMSRLRALWQVALPMARPWWIAGLTLALMELLADFGTVSIFNVDTFTTAIYKAWISLFNLDVAAQMASMLALIVLIVVLIEQHARTRQRYTTAQAYRLRDSDRWRFSRPYAWAASMYCGLVLGLAFVLPIGQLISWTLSVWSEDWDMRYWAYIGHSIALASLATFLVLLVAALLAYAARQRPHRLTTLGVRVATLGYALPGMLLAVGIFIPLNFLTQQLIRLTGWSALEPQIVLYGALITLLIALSARFLTVGFEPIQAALQRVTPSHEQAARNLGLGRWQVIQRLLVPMVSSGALAACLLVFVEIMKEMPITLMMRPFGWDTLAVRVFEMTAEGQWARAALPSLCIVLVGLIPLILLSREYGITPRPSSRRINSD